MNPPKPGIGDDYRRERITPRIRFSSWMPRAERAAREVAEKFRPRSLNTYPGHDGEPYNALANGRSESVDYFVCPWTHRPTKAEGQQRIDMANYVVRNAKRLGVKNAISGMWIWFPDGRGWRKYNPDNYKLWHPNDNYWSKGHFDHLHVHYLWD